MSEKDLQAVNRPVEVTREISQKKPEKIIEEELSPNDLKLEYEIKNRIFTKVHPPKLGYYSDTVRRDGIIRKKSNFKFSKNITKVVPIEEIVNDYREGRVDEAAAKFYVKLVKGKSVFKTGKMSFGLRQFLAEVATQEPFKSMILKRYEHEVDKKENRAFRMP